MKQFHDADAIVKKAWEYCHDLPIYQYYNGLSNENKSYDISSRKDRVRTSTSSMDIRYSMFCTNENSIYGSFLNERYRTVLTRWRSSSIDINIETGRYKHIPRHHHHHFSTLVETTDCTKPFQTSRSSIAAFISSGLIPVSRLMTSGNVSFRPFLPLACGFQRTKDDIISLEAR